MHLVKVAISQEIPSTLPLVLGRAKHVRKAITPTPEGTDDLIDRVLPRVITGLPAAD
jgi:hypothetical protein